MALLTGAVACPAWADPESGHGPGRASLEVSAGAFGIFDSSKGSRCDLVSNTSGKPFSRWSLTPGVGINLTEGGARFVYLDLRKGLVARLALVRVGVSRRRAVPRRRRLASRQRGRIPLRRRGVAHARASTCASASPVITCRTAGSATTTPAPRWRCCCSHFRSASRRRRPEADHSTGGPSSSTSTAPCRAAPLPRGGSSRRRARGTPARRANPCRVAAPALPKDGASASRTLRGMIVRNTLSPKCISSCADTSFERLFRGSNIVRRMPSSCEVGIHARADLLDRADQRRQALRARSTRTASEPARCRPRPARSASACSAPAGSR